MNFNPSNFLYNIKQIVTGLNGDSVEAAGQSGLGGTAQSADGGIKKDTTLPLSAITNLGGNTTLTTNGNMSVVQTTGNFSSGTIGHVSFMIPRDYDEASDHLAIRLVANLQNADAGVTMLGNSTILPVSSPTGNQTIGLSVPGTLPFATGPAVAAPLSQTSQVIEFNFSGQSLVRDEVFDVKLAYTGNATTGNATIYGVSYHYDSTIVSYNDTTSGDDVGSSITGVAGTLTGYGMPLR